VPPAEDIAYNKAAGAETREGARVRSYVLGHYKTRTKARSGFRAAGVVRDGNSYSVCSRDFTNPGLRPNGDVAQVFWLKDL